MALESVLPSPEVSVSLPISLAAWLVASAASVGLMRAVGHPAPSLADKTAASLLLPAGLLVLPWLGARALGPEVTAQVSWLASAVGWLSIAGGGVLGVQITLRLNVLPRAPRLAGTVIAAGVIGSAFALGQASLMPQWKLEAAQHIEGVMHITLHSLHMAALLAAPWLLVGAIVLCGLETRMRLSLDKERQAMQAKQLRDAATGLPNRAGLDEKLLPALRHTDETKGHLALVYVGLDGFRQVNEVIGKEGGDRLLLLMARRLADLAKPYLLARQSGDEFVILMDNNPGRDRVLDLANSVLESMGRPHREGEVDVSLTCSVGIALYPQHGGGATLLAHANVAMRAAKLMGGATYSFFDPRSVEQAREQGELLSGLRQVVTKGELQLYYQPKIHAPSGAITGVEALMRWQHPTRGMISPAVFVPLAERFGLINALGNWLIDEACRQARSWRDEGLRMRVAINLSVNQLSQPDLCARIGAALRKYQVNPSLLTCEITESVAMEDTAYVAKAFQELGALGVHISIDDFGTGYSSLGSLRKLPANELKIDRSFVMDIDSSEEARQVVGHVVSLAKTLNLQVVAEGVETDAQYQELRRLGVDQVQGYLFAKPMSAKALALWAINDMGPKEIKFRDSLFGTTELSSRY